MMSVRQFMILAAVCALIAAAYYYWQGSAISRHDVTGWIDDQHVYGEVEVFRNSAQVKGYVIYEGGGEVDFEGVLYKNGKIKGRDENKQYLELELLRDERPGG